MSSFAEAMAQVKRDVETTPEQMRKLEAQVLALADQPEVPTALDGASPSTRSLFTDAGHRRPMGRKRYKPPSLKQMAEAMYLFASAGGRLSNLRKQKQRERLEAEIRADLEYGQGTA